jgi:hypothetical protein
MTFDQLQALADAAEKFRFALQEYVAKRGTPGFYTRLEALHISLRDLREVLEWKGDFNEME